MSSACAASRADIAILGAGPAGVAVAVGLARLGHSVVMYSDRLRDAVEGGSLRVLQALQVAGLSEARASIQVVGTRTRDWAGARLINGQEYLIDRCIFDAALRRDAQAAGVRLVERHVIGCEKTADGWLVHTGIDPLRARVLVEARGRRFRGCAARGPRLLAVVQRYRVGHGTPATGVAMGAEGWYWFADDGVGHLTVQAVTAPTGAASREALRSRLFRPAVLPELIAERLAAAVACGEMRACAAGAACREPAATTGRLLAGDAALAVDPLSGHGIYEALAAAPANIAAVHTWLQGGDWDLVRMFLQERLRETWSRKLAAAGSFYEEAAAAGGAAFWQSTARAYEALASGSAMLHDPCMRIQRRPVLNGVRIELQRVLVAPQWPRGVWRHGDIEIAALLDACGPDGQDSAGAARRLQHPHAAVQQALRWLQHQGALPLGGAGSFQRAETVGAHMARSST